MKDGKTQNREQERWKDVKEYEGMYQVSTHGDVRSVDRVTPDKRNIKGRYLKIRLDRYGYSAVSLSKNSKIKNLKVHRLVAINFIKNQKNKPQVNHLDGNKTNNYYKNLEWATAKENQNHAWSHGLKENVKPATSKIGKKYASENNKKYKSKKIYCKQLNKEFDSISAAARFLNVSASGISACCRGKYKYAYRDRNTKEELTWEYV